MALIRVQVSQTVTSEQLRWIWTLVGFGGSIGGVIALGYMLNLRDDAQRDVQAITQVRPARMDLLRMLVTGDVSDFKIKAWAIAFLFLAITAEGLAGLAAIFTWSPVIIIVMLVAGEILLVLGLVMLVVLGKKKTERRKHVFSTLQVNRKAKVRTS